MESHITIENTSFHKGCRQKFEVVDNIQIWGRHRKIFTPVVWVVSEDGQEQLSFIRPLLRIVPCCSEPLSFYGEKGCGPWYWRNIGMTEGVGMYKTPSRRRARPGRPPGQATGRQEPSKAKIIRRLRVDFNYNGHRREEETKNWCCD